MELLATIAIIGLIVSLLLPAVQSAREAARRTSCGNNLKQIGLAIASFNTSQGAFPAGYATPEFNTIWGWAVFILPHLDQSSLYDRLDPAGRRLSALYRSGAAAADIALLQTNLPGYRCPSDTAPALNTLCQFGPTHYFDIATSNYVGNAGQDCASGSACNLLPGESSPCARLTPERYCAPRLTTDVGGVFFGRTGATPQGISAASVRDGLSQTLAVGERAGTHLAAVWAGAGSQTFNNEHTPRTVSRPLYPLNFDARIAGATNAGKYFASPHPGGVHFTLLDGSVQFLQDTLPHDLLIDMCNRRDGQPLSDF